MRIGTCNKVILIVFYDDNVGKLTIINSVDFQGFPLPRQLIQHWE